MTTHVADKGPPVPLIDSHPTVPPYRSLSRDALGSQMHTSHGGLTRNGSEPMPKRQKLEFGVEHGLQTPARLLGTPPATSNISANLSEATVDRMHLTSSSKDSMQIRQPSLFPVRPLRGSISRNKQQGGALAIERAAMKHTVPTKAYVAEPPAAAPQYQKGRAFPHTSDTARPSSLDTEPADFFPWTGHHPEDVLNEPTTRNGFYDKLPASQNESLTARPSILSSLKNKSGLQILSSLFASALDQRQVHGTVTATSTFKPPPRVTLTDTKREAWLRDLASPSIPLRRLSRTIPHGVRGKILLDHCLSKDIPISRAIWLVKCVGANEIRAFKRKGTNGVFTVGGESKWIKDWSTNVQQFLEAIFNNCGSAHWISNINYGLRLVSHIYAEHLLDHAQFLDWLVKSLARSDLDTIPVWLLLMRIHKHDLLRYRQHARHLVEAILAHLDQSKKPANRVTYNMVFQELVEECRVLIAASPESFLLPRCWNRYEEIIKDCVVAEDPLFEHRFNDLKERNCSLQDHTTRQDLPSQASPEQIIVAALDSLADTPDYPKIGSTCLRVAESHKVLVKTCLHWATSTYRYGQFRTYAAARLLRIWSEHSIDLHGPIFEFLAHGQDATDLQRPELFRLCEELVLSKHLSVGRYLQWLMARGALQNCSESNSGDVCELRLLRELPAAGLPDYVLNLRNSLLSSLGVSLQQEAIAIEALKSQIAIQLPALFPSIGNAAKLEVSKIDFCSGSRSVKFEIADWIRTTVFANLRGVEDLAPGGGSQQDPATFIQVEDFHAVRRLFEDFQEFSVFADILKALSTVKYPPLLTAITDTVNYHFDIFHAIGAAKDLFHNLYEQKKLLPTQEGTDQYFTHTLIDLATRLPRIGQELRRLRKEEMSLDPKQTAAAPSPISDNMVEAVHSDNPTFAEEMDQILTNGTSIDQPTLARVFSTITDHFEKSWDEANAFPCRYPELLARLRAFDRKSFDALAARWLDTLLLQSARPALSTVLVPLICHKVFTLDNVLSQTMKFTRDQASEENASLKLQMLEMLSSMQIEHMPAVEYRSYRFLHQQQYIIRTRLEWLVSLIHSCMIASIILNGSSYSKARSLMDSGKVKSVVQMALSQLSSKNKQSSQYDQALQSAVTDIIYQEEQSELAALDLHQRISRLLGNVNNLNRPLSQLGLRMILSSSSGSSEMTQSASAVLGDVLIARLGHTPHAQVALWSDLLSNLVADSALSIRETAEQEILSSMDDGHTSFSPSYRSRSDDLLAFVVATAFSIPDTETSPMLDQLSERLSRLISSSMFNHSQNGRPELDHLARDADILLRLLIVHQSTLQHPKFSQTTLSQICLSLTLICTHLSFPSHLNLVDRIFDVLAFASDYLSEDTRSRCIQTLANSHGMQTPRIRFIFGDSNTSSEGEWLQLVSKPASTSTGKAEADLTAPTTSMHPYPLRRWEMMQDATPVVTENDTSLSLALFGSRKSVL